MVGLYASKLPYEELRAGDYFSYAFVCGDPREHRMTRILAIDQCDHGLRLKLRPKTRSFSK
ncbi:LOW QUALITY PROTEIN: hypothetical protein PHMEG_00020352 [Phytophthora megakarya]|uniref:Uncharacterized protein n=1 Tax=Phytophthora megakarya TaxID=4795 RepID=A0A225VQV6_9STRA|nr:LOW QUALITY PROTEIN: hypothetical protein PHMEG_00020352 [Phytophthora megakarya]